MRSVRAAGESWICTETRPKVSAPFHVAAICFPFRRGIRILRLPVGGGQSRVANSTGEQEAKPVLFVFGIPNIWDMRASDISQFTPNAVCGKARAQQGAIERCDLAVVESA